MQIEKAEIIAAVCHFTKELFAGLIGQSGGYEAFKLHCVL